jgi:hypothetical protein
MRPIPLLLLASAYLLFACDQLCPADDHSAAADAVRVVASPPVAPGNRSYVTNREPLAPSPLVRLPVGSVTPRGWLRHQLELEANGMTGRLEEVSPWCKFDGNAWTNPQGHGHSGWEEMPYWLKGYGDLGYVLRDERIIADAKRWIDAILASQDDTGWFGPRALLTSKDCGGKADLWPNMLALNALQSYYDHSKDERVLPFMDRYFRWELNYPDKDFLAGYWPKMRGGDNLESVYWLYNRTGEPWLLDLAKKVHAHTADWSGGVANWHGVNFTQSFREPAEYWMQAREDRFLQATERDYREAKQKYGQVPGGGFGSDENARPGHGDPRQGFETCSIVEFMHSFEMLTRITGNPVWSDRCEELAFNTFPASQTPDLHGLHYLTCPNMVSLDKGDKSPGIQNGGTMFSYSPFAVYRCCQHNVAMGWPYFAEELWLATADNGLCASLYSASEVTAKVGADGAAEVKVAEVTDYPFADTITFTVSTPKPVKFPLYLRVPGWAGEIGVGVAPKGRRHAPDRMQVAPKPGYAVIDRTWSDGDNVTLQLPMKLSVRRWEGNQNSASVDYGPLTFSLRIGEEWKRYGGSEAWPEFEVLPATPWNYGLVLDEHDPTSGMEIVKKPAGPLPDQPFTPEAAPITIKAKAKKIPRWTTDAKGLIRPLQPSPVKSDGPTETVTLIPMGAARLRIAQFPVIGDGSNAREWTEPPAPAVSASHCFAGDSVEALIDGKEPKDSNDHSIPRFTWWDHKGAAEWVQRDFPTPRKVSEVAVYWFDDRPANGGCRVPASWELLYKAGDEWKPVKPASGGGFGVERNRYNEVTFEPVETTALRMRVKLQDNFSAGILEWKVK